MDPFEQPMNLTQAVDIMLRKDILPTDLDSAGIRELDASLRAQSMFSAKTANEYLLMMYRDRIGSMLEAKAPEGEASTLSSPTYIRRDIKDFLREVGYQPSPEERGTLADLSSDARINLVVATNAQLAQGQGRWMQGQNAGVLDQYPGDELFRLSARHVPRLWLVRWRTAGMATGDPIGKGWTITVTGRMIALKNHPIWKLIGSSALFPDALDVQWPPFAFNSGMWVRDVDREQCEGFGLLRSGQEVKPMSLSDAFSKN